MNNGDLRRRRSSLDITVEILSAIQQLEMNDRMDHWKARVQASVFISWKSYKKYLSDLEKQRLIKGTGGGLTEEGKQFLQDYRRDLRPVLAKYKLIGDQE